MIRMDAMAPAQYQAWLLMFKLSRMPWPWVLVGGQMTALLAAEAGFEMPRPTPDADILVDVRAAPGAIAKLSDWLVDRGFQLAGISADGVGQKFLRQANPGPGEVEVDLLAPEGLSETTDTTTRPPARTVGVPASSSLLHNATTVHVQIADLEGHEAAGDVPRPNVLAALIGKAAATTLPVRAHPERDWQDAALLASLLPNPRIDPTTLSRSERAHLRRLQPLTNPDHTAWRVLPVGVARQGQAAVQLVVAAVG